MKKLVVISALLMAFGCAKEEPVECLTEEPTSGVSQTLFTTNSQPVFESPIGLAADPSVIRVGEELRMYYSAEGYKIGVVISTDNGLSWNAPDGNEFEDYGALSAQPDNWDQTLETIDVLKVGDTFYMYYTGYIEGQSDNPYVANYEIGLATSQDGIHFSRHPASIDQPILARDISDQNTNDRHAMTSPGVQFVDGVFYMTYTGWNVADDWTGINAGFKIIGATSLDGVNWTKLDEPIIESSDVVWSPDINETSLIFAENDYWYIPFSTDMSIGIARSTVFEGPYEIYHETIISPNGTWGGEVTAPDGFVDDGKMRLWFHGVETPLYWPWVIGYAEANYPLIWDE